MFKKLLDDYECRELIMEAKDFLSRSKVTAHTNHKYQRRENGPDHLYKLETKKTRA